MGEPAIVDVDNSVAGSEEHVEVLTIAVNLGQPMWIRHICVIAGVLEGDEHARHVVAAEDDVEILRVAVALRVA